MYKISTKGFTSVYSSKKLRVVRPIFLPVSTVFLQKSLGRVRVSRVENVKKSLKSKKGVVVKCAVIGECVKNKKKSREK